MMKKRKLGKSGIEVTPLGLGCMEIGGRMKDHEGFLLTGAGKEAHPDFFLGDVDDDRSVDTIRYALDSGIDFFDTAPAYGAGHSERVLGRALSGRRDGAIIATKFGKYIDEDLNIFGSYPDERTLIGNIREECERSLVRLGTDRIDLYQYHQMNFTLTEYADEVIDILESLVRDGKIRYYGWSTENPDCARIFARGDHCTAVQHAMNVLTETPEILRICERFDLASISRGIMGMGFLTGKYTPENYKTLLSPDDFRLRDEASILRILERIEPIKRTLTENGRTIPQGSLAWNWARSGLTIPIVGFRNREQIEEAVRALEYGPLTDDQMKRIDERLGKTDRISH